MTFAELMRKWDIKPRCHSGVGDGWCMLLDGLMFELVSRGFDPTSQVDQIKEKFGGLRFYATLTGSESHAHEMNKLIEACEEASNRTCENCGKPGERRQGSWIKTMCDCCDKDRKELFASLEES